MLSYIFHLLVYPALLLLCIFAGRRTAARSQRKSYQWKPLGIENGLMGFYALLVSFTLVQSSNHAKERSEMAQRLADELSELLRINQTLDPELGKHVRQFVFQSYKIMQERDYPSIAAVYSAIGQVEALDARLDKHFLAFIQTHPQSRAEIVAMMAKLDRLESVAYRILHSYHRHTPVFILFVLVLFSLLMAFLLGFIGKYNNNHIHISTTIFVLISFITINFIHDLDSPSRGFIKPDFQDIKDVIKTYLIDKR